MVQFNISEIENNTHKKPSFKPGDLLYAGAGTFYSDYERFVESRAFFTFNHQFATR